MPKVVKVPCEKQEEWITREQILVSQTNQIINDYFTENYGPKGEFICKYINNGTNIQDEIDLIASGKQDLIAMNLLDLKRHLQNHPEDSYFFFNPKAQLVDVSQLDFGLCSCVVPQSDGTLKVKHDNLEKMISEDICKHIIKKDILKCYLNDAKNAESVLVLISLPGDIMQLSETIRNKIEIMKKKPDKLESVTFNEDKNKPIIGGLELRDDQTSKQRIIKGFKLDFTSDNQLNIFGIVNDEGQLTPQPIANLTIDGQSHLTLNLVKCSFTSNKTLFTGTKEQKEAKVFYQDEKIIDFHNLRQMKLDSELFMAYSFKTAGDIIQCWFDKIGIIKNGQFWNCEHASVPYVVHEFVDKKLTEKIKEEEKEKQRLYLIEQQRIEEKEKQRLYLIEQQRIEEKEKQRLYLIEQQRIAEKEKQRLYYVTAAACIGYGAWQVFKWSAAIASAPATGGLSIGAAMATP